jgi:hypothetical protein
MSNSICQTLPIRLNLLPLFYFLVYPKQILFLFYTFFSALSTCQGVESRAIAFVIANEVTQSPPLPPGGLRRRKQRSSQ